MNRTKSRTFREADPLTSAIASIAEEERKTEQIHSVLQMWWGCCTFQNCTLRSAVAEDFFIGWSLKPPAIEEG